MGQVPMLYMTPEEVEAFGPDSVPVDATPLERARRAMLGAGCWEKGQQMGSRWPIGCVALEVTQRCNLDCTLCYLSEHSEMVRDIPLAEVFRRIDLDTFLEFVSRVSPRSAASSFPSREDKLAYYLNAYNALSMFNVIDSGFPESLSGMAKVWFFGFKRFPVGGERMSLYSLENDVIRPLGDERVHFALNCMSVSCPRLPRVPFRAGQLNRQLDAEARQFFAESRNLQVIPERKLVRVSSILKFYTGDFLTKSPTLVSYINKYTSGKVPEDYQIEFSEYDWTVNDSRRRRTGNGGRMCGAIDGNRSAACRGTVPAAIADYRDVGPRRASEPR